MKIYTLMGLPEGDGSFPFALIVQLVDNTFILTGLAGGTSGKPTSDLLAVPKAEAKAYVDRLTASLRSVNGEIFHGLLIRAWGKNHPEGFEELKHLLPPARNLDLPEYDEPTAIQTKQLMNPESGAFFKLGESNYKQGIAAIYMAFRNPVETQQKIISAAIDVTADMALDDYKCQRWQLAMEVLSVVATSMGNAVVAMSALHNAVAFSKKLPGSKIPFVRDWVDQQLASAVAMARLVEKAKHINSESSEPR